jgi:hypothetical protein
MPRRPTRISSMDEPEAFTRWCACRFRRFAVVRRRHESHPWISPAGEKVAGLAPNRR